MKLSKPKLIVRELKMSESIGWILSGVGLFACALLFGYSLTLLFKRKAATPTAGATVRIRANDAVYRTHFQTIEQKLWVFSAPLQRDHFVPIRPGENLIVEVPSKKGVLLARGHVVSRDIESHELRFEPRSVMTFERREERRLTGLDEWFGEVDGKLAQILDLSPHGVRLRCESVLAKGQRIRLDLPNRVESVFGYVLVSEIGDEGFEYRIIFESEIKLP